MRTKLVVLFIFCGSLALSQTAMKTNPKKHAFQAAANKWGATLTSTQPIVVLATWEALSCTSTGAVLGSAGAVSIERNFPGVPAPIPGLESPNETALSERMAIQATPTSARAST